MDWPRLWQTVFRDSLRFSLIFLVAFSILEGLAALLGQPVRWERPVVVALAFWLLYAVGAPTVIFLFWLVRRAMERK